jgi:hypothetical protein
MGKEKNYQQPHIYGFSLSKTQKKFRAQHMLQYRVLKSHTAYKLERLGTRILL